MKKLSVLLLSLVMVLTFAGCGNDSIKEDVVATKTCSRQNDGYEEIYKWTATNDKIEKVELSIVYDNSMFGVETLSTLTNEQKEQIRKNMLTTLGLESNSYEGIEINIDIEDKMTVSIDADLKKADEKVLKKVGLDFSDTDLSLKTAVSAAEEDGASCK